MIDTAYVSDAITWLIVWSTAGMVGRQLLAKAEYDRQQRQQHETAGKVAR